MDEWTVHAIFRVVRPLQILLLGSALAARALAAQQLEALWYSTGAPRSTESFLAHADRVSIVSPQVFSFDNEGAIHGRLDKRLVDTARAKGVKLVPLVVNPGFSQPLIHRILNVAPVRQRAIESLVALCRDQHLDGIQFDIENVNVVDKDAFTSFVRDASARLHAANCSVSAAVVPRTGENPGPSAYHKWIFENWRGAYDYKALAESLDFLSYMTYAQHTGGTPPGPVAGYPWMEECLQYVLSLGVPPSKISLGIPSYSDHWYRVVHHGRGGAIEGRRFRVREGRFAGEDLSRDARVGRPRESVVRVLEQRRRFRARVDRGRAGVRGEARVGAEIQAARILGVGAGHRRSASVGPSVIMCG